MMMITQLILALLLTGGAVAQAEGQPKAVTGKVDTVTTSVTKLNWLPFDSVRATFPAAPKPLFLYISEKGCHHCEYMDTAVFNRPELVKYVNENLTPVRVDIYMDTPIKLRDTVMNEQQFRKLLSIQGVPAYYFFDTNGRIIGALDSEMDLLKFKRMLVYIRDRHFFVTPWEKFLTLPAASEEAINKRFQSR
ncbi:MAG: thioredoxin fold domain-containing protein [Candidatus Zixiibacteriota bacterium]